VSNSPPLSTRRRRLIVGALLVGTFLASLEVMVVSPAMPAVVSEFGGAGLYAWVFTAYIGAQTLTMPLYGRMADRAGRRDAYLLGVTLFVAGSIWCALAGSMEAVVAGRLVQGMGAGALVPLTMTIFGDLYEVEARTRMQGIFSLVWGVSSLLGPLAGGWLTETLSWRSIFWLNVVPGAVAGGLVFALLPRALGRTRARGPSLLGAMATLLRGRTQQTIFVSGLALGAALMGVIGYLPVQVQAIDGGTALDAGIALIPASVAWTIAANVSGRLVRPMGFGTLVRLGSALVVAGTVISAVWTAHPVGLMIFGLGMGVTISSYNVSAQVAAPPQLIGQATSLTLFARSIGSAVGVAAFGVLAGLEPGAEDFSEVPGLAEGVGDVFVGTAVCAVLALVVVLARFPRQVERESPAPRPTSAAEEPAA
jgi:MFS family permease